MKRLTFRYEDGGYAYLHDCDGGNLYPKQSEAIQLLAAYEDTELTPEQIHALKAEHERLKRIVDLENSISRQTEILEKLNFEASAELANYKQAIGDIPLKRVAEILQKAVATEKALAILIAEVKTDYNEQSAWAAGYAGRFASVSEEDEVVKKELSKRVAEAQAASEKTGGK